MISRSISCLRCCIPYSINATRLILIDRGMFLADFFLATTVPFLMQFMIWSYLYHQNSLSALGSMSLQQTLFYYAFAIAFGRLNNGYDIIAGFSQVVRDGSLEPHLLRPLPYPLQKFADFMGGGLLYTIPIFLIFIVFAFRNAVFPTPSIFFGGIALLVLSQILCFTVSWTAALMALSLTRTDFALSLLTTSAAFFGGELLPPRLWPNWLRPLMLYNPFRFMISAPAEVIVTMDTDFLYTSILWTVGYSIFFACISMWVWKMAVKKYQGAGG